MMNETKEFEVRLPVAVALILATIISVIIAGNYIGYKYFWDQYDHTTRLDRELQTAKSKLRKDKENLDNILQVGWIYYQMDQKQEALTYYEKVLEKDPNHIQGLYNSGLIYLDQKKYSEAEKRFLAIQRMYPKHLENLLALGEVYLGMNKPDRALETFQDLANLKSSWTQVHYNLGQAYLLKKMIPEAERSLKEALKYDPNFKPAMDKLASIEGGKDGQPDSKTN